MDVLEPGERKIGENLAAQTASADDKNFGLVAKKVLDLRQASVWPVGERKRAYPGSCHECGIGTGTWRVEYLVYMVVAPFPVLARDAIRVCRCRHGVPAVCEERQEGNGYRILIIQVEARFPFSSSCLHAPFLFPLSSNGTNGLFAPL